MTIDRMIEKARKLLESGRVEKINIDSYNVVGDHGTYLVVRDSSGKISCNCQGFLKKGKCSHSTAVIMLTKLKRKGLKKSNT